jgi:hypothetical protein
MAQPSVSRSWGCSAAERALAHPCDALLPGADEALFRGVDVDAPARVAFRWLCQLRVAPYSYDWIDNLGRRSPRSLTPGLDRLERGQRVMTIFELADFARDEHLTLWLRSASGRQLFGECAVSYVVAPTSERTCRLRVKFLVRYPRGVFGALVKAFLPWGDLVMMRKQLLTLKALAERWHGVES